jgi:hypothetical protein
VQLGLASSVVPELSLAETMSLASALGFDAVEAECWPRGSVGQMTAIDVAELNVDSARRIHVLSKRAGAGLSGLACVRAALESTTDQGLPSFDHYRAMVDAAKLLDLPAIVVDPRPLHRLRRQLADLAAYAAQRSVDICIEYPEPTLVGGPALIPTSWFSRTELSRTPLPSVSYVPLRLQQADLDEIAPIARLGTSVHHVRAEDTWQLYDRAKKLSDSTCEGPAPLSLRVRWLDCLLALGRVGFHGPVTVNLAPPWQEMGLDRRVEALRAAAIFLRSRLPGPGAR